MRRFLPTLTLAAIFLAVWQGYCALSGVSPLVLPGPVDVLRSLVLERERIAPHAVSTITVAGLGFSTSVLFAFSTSLALHFSLWLERGFMPLLVASQTIPLVALAPLMILWFGFGLLPKVLLVILVTFFPILVSLLSGYRQTPRAYIDLLNSMGASRALVIFSRDPALGAGVVLRGAADLGHLRHRRHDLRRICRRAAGSGDIHPDVEEQLPRRSGAGGGRRVRRSDSAPARDAPVHRQGDRARAPEGAQCCGLRA